MRRRIFIVCFVLVLSYFPCSSLARTYFVDTEGNDDADGSKSQPWRTISRACQKISAGDEIVVRDGKYTAGFELKGLKGKKDQPIVIRAHKDERVLIDVTSASGTGVLLTNCTHIVIKGLEITGVTKSNGINVQDCQHCIIEGNVVYSCSMVGIRLSASNDNVLQGNICYYNDTSIYVGKGSTENLVEANVCVFGNKSSENADGIGSSNCMKNTYRYNLVAGNNDDGLDMWTSKQCVIEWNFSCANGDLLDGDGNGFKLGGKWKHLDDSSPWDGGGHIVQNNLSVWNMSTGFTDNGSSGNKYEGNAAFGNRNTGSYASVKHTDPAEAERIRANIRKRFAALIAENVICPEVHPLPMGIGIFRELKVWP